MGRRREVEAEVEEIRKTEIKKKRIADLKDRKKRRVFSFFFQ